MLRLGTVAAPVICGLFVLAFSAGEPGLLPSSALVQDARCPTGMSGTAAAPRASCIGA